MGVTRNDLRVVATTDWDGWATSYRSVTDEEFRDLARDWLREQVGDEDEMLRRLASSRGVLDEYDEQRIREARYFARKILALLGEPSSDLESDRPNPSFDGETSEEAPRCGEGPHGDPCDEVVVDGACPIHGAVGPSEEAR